MTTTRQTALQPIRHGEYITVANEVDMNSIKGVWRLESHVAVSSEKDVMLDI